MMMQLGLLGLEVLSEGLLQCRTQQWNSSASINTDRERDGGGKEGGKEEERKGKGRGGGGGTNHVISLLLTSPRAATKGGMLSYVLYSVALPCFLSLREKG